MYYVKPISLMKCIVLHLDSRFVAFRRPHIVITHVFERRHTRPIMVEQHISASHQLRIRYVIAKVLHAVAHLVRKRK